MPQSDDLRRKRQRKTKAQLIEELEAADARLAGLPKGGSGQANDYQRTILESIPLPVTVVRESDGTFLYCNEPAASMTGRKPEQIVGVSAVDMYWVPDDRERFLKVMTEQGQVDDLEVEFKRVDDEPMWVLLSSRSITYQDQACFLTTWTEITRRKRAEKKLRAANKTAAEAEERLQNATHIAHLGHWIWDEVEDRMSYVSDELARIYGLSPDEVVDHLESFEDLLNFIHPDDRETYREWADHWSETYRDGDPVGETMSLEYRLLQGSGGVRYVRELATVAFDADGTLTHSRGTLQDVTEIKEVEAALRESEERFNEAVQIAHLGHWVWDEVEDKIEYCSDECARIHGYTVEAYMARMNSTDADVGRVHPDDHERVEKALRDAQLNADTCDVEYRIVRPDGAVRHIRELGKPILDGSGKLVRSIGTVQDITERKQVEMALSESEERLVALIDNSPAEIVLKDANGRYLQVNRVFEDRYQLNKADVIGKMASELFPGEGAEIEEQDREVVESRRTDDTEMDIFVDGEPRTHLETKFPILDAKGEVIGIGGMATDITDRKRADEELRAAVKASEAANLAKSEFLSAMSHELRTPLNGVLGFAQLIDTDIEQPLAEAHKDSVHEIIRSGRHLLDLINEILDLAKIEAGKVALSMENVSVGQVVVECMAVTGGVAEMQEITVNNRIAEGPSPVVYADMTRFKQVMLNLLSNAVKYNRRGGTVTIDCEETASGMIKVTVEDMGEGISEQDHEIIFDPFSRVLDDPAAIEGTGIGLAITRRLVEVMGGRIGLESTKGEGTTFWVEFPTGSPETAHKASGTGDQADTVEDAHKVSGSVLYVEDNPANMKLVERLISRLPNVTLIGAHNAELGLELARVHQPDLILMDINLPGMNGIEALKVLGEMEQTDHIPVVAVSANAMPRDVKEGLDAGFLRYLSKPIDIKELRETIATALDGNL